MYIKYILLFLLLYCIAHFSLSVTSLTRGNFLLYYYCWVSPDSRSETACSFVNTNTTTCCQSAI